MSNNREVDYDGDSYFFASTTPAMVERHQPRPQVGLAYQAKSGLLRRSPSSSPSKAGRA